MTTATAPLSYGFMRKASRILNARISPTVLVSGNIQDLFYQTANNEYVPLVELLTTHWNVKSRILVTYELNGGIRFVSKEGEDVEKIVEDAWQKMLGLSDKDERAIRRTAGRTWEKEEDTENDFRNCLAHARQSSAFALEFLRQLCICSRQELLDHDLIIVIEQADMLIPDGEIARLSDADRQRVAICQDWFSDFDFTRGDDAVVLVSESRSLLHHKISRLAQLEEVQIASPSEAERLHFIQWFQAKHEKKVQLWDTEETFALLTAALTIRAMTQLMVGARYDERTVTPKDVIEKVERFIQDQLGDDVVEFLRPEHTLDQCVGISDLRPFLIESFIPRIKTSGKGTLVGAVIAGPLGAGKTFIFLAVAGELGIPVLVLKNFRSMWYGQSDVIFERLKRVLEALSKVLIFLDEADTQFGGVGKDVHETEKRLTGKIQALISDPKLKGKVHWLFMTARVENLSPDIRRPRRAGDLIIPILDPEGEDRNEFLRMTLKPVWEGEIGVDVLERLNPFTEGYSAAAFDALQSELVACSDVLGRKLMWDDVQAVVSDLIPPAIDETRRYQELQALINCTRKSLWPKKYRDKDFTAQRREWRKEIKKLEAMGIHN